MLCDFVPGGGTEELSNIEVSYMVSCRVVSCRVVLCRVVS